MTVPDAVDPVVGWRYWKVTSGGLASLNVNGGYWPTRAAHHAQCKAMPFPNIHSPDVVPHELCSCGIYAARDLETLKDIVYPFADSLFRRRRIAVGEVSLWGRVIEGQRGYRAEYAYPKSLYLVSRNGDDAWCRFSEVALEGAYGVPVGRLAPNDAVGRNPELKALFGLIGMASASIVVATVAGRTAARRANRSERSGDPASQVGNGWAPDPSPPAS
jgi:hypothetical protein